MTNGVLGVFAVIHSMRAGYIGTCICLFLLTENNRGGVREGCC
jgi:hypothetical protein